LTLWGFNLGFFAQTTEYALQCIFGGLGEKTHVDVRALADVAPTRTTVSEFP
jgi:hypothetical protein